MTEPSLLVPVRLLAFDACHLDVARHWLRRGEHEISLRPKSWDVLGYLVERPGLLVTGGPSTARSGPTLRCPTTRSPR
jgi:hypothetical protein